MPHAISAKTKYLFTVLSSTDGNSTEFFVSLRNIIFQIDKLFKNQISLSNLCCVFHPFVTFQFLIIFKKYIEIFLLLFL